MPALWRPTPAPGATGVAVATRTITATFSKAMNPATLTNATFFLACPVGTAKPGVVSYANNVATLTLPADLPLQALRGQLFLADHRDGAGNPVEDSLITGSSPLKTAAPQHRPR